MRGLKALIHKFGRWYCSEVCRREFVSQSFRRMNERPIEFSFVFRQLLKTCPKTVLDVGTGETALPDLMRNCGFLVTATDNVKDYWPAGMFNRHYYVINDDITDTLIEERFDFITCVSVLEHIEAYDSAVRNMFKLLRVKGHLALTFPYNETRYVPDVYKLPGAGRGQNAPYICQVFSKNEIERWLDHNKGRIIEQVYWQCYEGEFWTFGRQVLPACEVTRDDRHQFTCVLIQKIE